VTSTHGDRKLGEEYRKAQRLAVRSGPKDWIARADLIPGYLDKAIRDKVNRYRAAYSSWWLVVYLNIDEWGIRQKEIEQVIVDTMLSVQQSIPRHLRALEGHALQRQRQCVERPCVRTRRPWMILAMGKRHECDGYR